MNFRTPDTTATLRFQSWADYSNSRAYKAVLCANVNYTKCDAVCAWSVDFKG